MKLIKIAIIALIAGVAYYYLAFNTETVEKGVKKGVEVVTGKRQRDALKDVKKQVGDIEKTRQKNLDDQLGILDQQKK